MTQDYRPRPRELARELLNGYLVEHQLRSGDRLPSERSLCEAWGLSRSALRSATARMEKDGVLCSRPGAGTYVAQRKYTRNLQGLLSLSRSASEQGRRVTTRLLDLKRIECDKTLAKRFGQVLGYPLYKVARLRMVDGEPLMVETAFLPAERVEGLEKWDLERSSLFAVLEEAYGLIPEQGEEKVSITYATTDEAELMGIEEGAPLFWIVSQTYDQNGELLEYCRAAARPRTACGSPVSSSGGTPPRGEGTSMRHEEAIGPNSPLYLQLRELIRGKIEGGEYPPARRSRR